MKNTRRISAFVASVLAVACMAAPMTQFTASAAVTAGSISFVDETQSLESDAVHTYAAYKIFSGEATISAFTAKAELTGTQWATGVDADAFLAALKADARFGEGESNLFYNCETAAAVASVLATFAANDTNAKAFADFAIENKDSLGTALASSGGVISVTEDGYYVIEETEVKDGTMTAHLLGVYDSATGAEITVKSDLPTFQKKIKDADDTAAGAADGSDTNQDGAWNDSADYDMGDKIPYQLTATLPTDYATYKEYLLVFHDNIDDGVLTYDADSVKVYYQNGSEDAVEIDAQHYVVTTPGSANAIFSNANGDTTENLTITIDNLKKVSDKITASTKIIVEYTATLTDKANLGEVGNWNSGYLEYSNNPYFEGSGDTTSRTEEDMVVAFTYQAIVNKVDNSNNALAGAGFTLYKKNGDAWDTVKEIAAGTATTFTFTGIDAGQYKLEETEVPTGFNKADDVLFTVKAVHDVTADTPALTSLDVIDDTGATMRGFTVDATAGTLSTTIINNSGASLPSTGGIGTTIFYVGGGILAVGAGVLLVSKKRMSNK